MLMTIILSPCSFFCLLPSPSVGSVSLTVLPSIWSLTVPCCSSLWCSSCPMVSYNFLVSTFTPGFTHIWKLGSRNHKYRELWCDICLSRSGLPPSIWSYPFAKGPYSAFIAHVPEKARRGHWILWSGSYRPVWAAWRVYWDHSILLTEQLLTTKPSPSPTLLLSFL